MVAEELHTTMRRIIAAWVAQPHPSFRLSDGTTPDDIGTLALAATIGIHQQWRVAPDRVDLHRAFQTLRQVLLASLTSR